MQVGTPNLPIDAKRTAAIRLVYFEGMDKETCPAIVCCGGRLDLHGTPMKRNEYLWADRPSRMYARIAADEGDELFCYGHTHETLHKLVGQQHFVACGSVGCGSHSRARYAVIYLGQPDLAVGFRSVDYDSTGVAASGAASTAAAVNRRRGLKTKVRSAAGRV